MDSSPESTVKQISIEKRFNCVVCLCARFQMVYGRCQHRICSRCAYGSSNVLRRQFHRCPSCQQKDAFPDTKPTIPEDNIELQRMLGVMACQNKGCTQEFWSWEKFEHDLTCPYKNSSPGRQKRCSDTGENRSKTLPKSTSRTRHAGHTPKKSYRLRSKDNSHNTAYRKPDYSGHLRSSSRQRQQRS